MVSLKSKQIDPIPDEFSSYEEAAKFWDTHYTTDYSDALQDVDVDVKAEGTGKPSSSSAKIYP